MITYREQSTSCITIPLITAVNQSMIIDPCLHVNIWLSTMLSDFQSQLIQGCQTFLFWQVLELILIECYIGSIRYTSLVIFFKMLS